MPRAAIVATTAASVLLLLGACSSGSNDADVSATSRASDAFDTADAPGTLSAAAAAGEALFFDTSLSASGRQSCATCHVPARAFTADPATDDGLPVPLGGAQMDLPGFRNAPSLAYASFTPALAIESDGTARGGFFRDGRASSLAEQAQEPFLTPFEIADGDAAQVVGRLEASPATLAKFTAAYGASVLEQPTQALIDVGLAIAAFETESPRFHPFSSKYDFWLAGQATLSAQELRGLALFNDPGKGNCAACHPSRPQGYSSHALFTDFTYDAVGLPRNWRIPANQRDPVSPVDGTALDYIPKPVNVPADAEYAWYDLGLCGPFQPAATDLHPRATLSATTTYCGDFKVPTLRNVAITAPYFHNGVFATLREVVEWYVTRDINDDTANNPTPVPAGPSGNPYAASGTFYTTRDGAPDLYEYN
ncbi:MAG: cytochrome-c peroxidase, partial [Steroidobacteraceae bacterium]